jgi:adenylate cyclase class 2
MSHEIEAKFRVASLDPVRKALRAEGAEYLGTVLQTDRFYDQPNRAYARGGSGLRLRCLRVLRHGRVRLDDRPMITFKGPVEQSRLKRRREIQTRLDCAETAHELLEACGLRLVLTVQKRRRSYRLGPCLVELDELPLLGAFIEIEGRNERQIEAVAQRLNIHAPHLHQSYAQLLREHLKKIKKKSRTVTFEKFA